MITNKLFSYYIFLGIFDLYLNYENKITDLLWLAHF
jgi:hypothetical protein